MCKEQFTCKLLHTIFRQQLLSTVMLDQWFPNCGPWPNTRPPKHFQWTTEPFEHILLFCYAVDNMCFVLKNIIFTKR